MRLYVYMYINLAVSHIALRLYELSQLFIPSEINKFLSHIKHWSWFKSLNVRWRVRKFCSINRIVYHGYGQSLRINEINRFKLLSFEGFYSMDMTLFYIHWRVKRNWVVQHASIKRKRLFIPEWWESRREGNINAEPISMWKLSNPGWQIHIDDVVEYVNYEMVTQPHREILGPWGIGLYTYTDIGWTMWRHRERGSTLSHSSRSIEWKVYVMIYIRWKFETRFR